MLPPTLSIDYGTSNTVAVLRRSDGQLRPLLFGASPLLPSGVYARPDDGELLTGLDASRRAARDPAAYEPYPKRRIDDGEVLLGNRSIDVPELMAATLRRVRSEARRVAGTLPSTVVVTHPAAWGSHRRALLLDAARRADLHEPVLVPEPVAASAHFAALPHVSIRPGEYLLAFDLGAGTFDVTLVRCIDSGFEVVVSDGLDDVGGADLDELIIQQVGLTVAAANPDAWRRLTVPESLPDRRSMLELRDSAKHAKEALSDAAATELRVPVANRDMHLTRAEFETAATPMLERTVAMTRAVIGRAGIEVSGLKGLFLVGGASRVPLVASLLHRGIGVAPTVLDQPELVVAEGGLAFADRRATTPGRAVPDQAVPAPALVDSGAAGQPSSAPAASGQAEPVAVSPAPAVQVARAPAVPRFSQVIDLDFGAERRRAVRQSIVIITLSAFILPVAMFVAAVTSADYLGALLPFGLITMLGFTCGLLRLAFAPPRYSAFGIDVDERGIAVQDGRYSVSQAWANVEVVEVHDEVLVVSGAVEAACHTPSIDVSDGVITAGPMDPSVLGALADALSFHGGAKFAGVTQSGRLS